MFCASFTGCEKDVLIDILTQRCNSQRLMIAEAYRDMYGRVWHSALYFHYFCLSCIQCSCSALLSGQSLESKACQAAGWHQQTGTQLCSCNYWYLWKFHIVIYITAEVRLHSQSQIKGHEQFLVHSPPLLTKAEFLDRLISLSTWFWGVLHYFL